MHTNHFATAKTSHRDDHFDLNYTIKSRRVQICLAEEIEDVDVFGLQSGAVWKYFLNLQYVAYPCTKFGAKDFGLVFFFLR